MKETPPLAAVPLSEKIAPLLEDLLYPSESDEPLQFLSAPWDGSKDITPQEFVDLFDLEAADAVKEKEPERFWSPVTEDQEWYEAEEKERTARFVALRKILEENLEHIQYFEVGEIEVGLYLIGQSAQNIMGIQTMAVRT
ncbi:nuclease A inhibitor family protein [Salmonirosea aquatica]|uniref:Nuclease n=1 Tax=Salmonirosea aquatica TaxID=2654236 RepID=A0A7C9BIW4_9BACT|nr:nuclease [Cytophagaceae bacterium SJW1-29]